MELTAALEGIDALDEPSTVEVYTDSRYVRDGVTKWLQVWKNNG